VDLACYCSCQYWPGFNLFGRLSFFRFAFLVFHLSAVTDLALQLKTVPHETISVRKLTRAILELNDVTVVFKTNHVLISPTKHGLFQQSFKLEQRLCGHLKLTFYCPDLCLE